MIIKPDDHFVDRTIQYFESEYINNMNRILDNHFGDITTLMDQFSTSLREQAPIDYPMTPTGEAIRVDLGKIIPELKDKAPYLRSLLPNPMRPEEEALVPVGPKVSDTQDKNIDLDALYKASANIESGAEGAGKHRRTREAEKSSKRIKHEQY